MPIETWRTLEAGDRVKLADNAIGRQEARLLGAAVGTPGIIVDFTGRQYARVKFDGCEAAPLLHPEALVRETPATTCLVWGCGKPRYVLFDQGVKVKVDGELKPLEIRYAFCEGHSQEVLAGRCPWGCSGPCDCWDRFACKQAGAAGHQSCGACPTCGGPRHACPSAHWKDPS